MQDVAGSSDEEVSGSCGFPVEFKNCGENGLLCVMSANLPLWHMSIISLSSIVSFPRIPHPGAHEWERKDHPWPSGLLISEERGRKAMFPFLQALDHLHQRLWGKATLNQSEIGSVSKWTFTVLAQKACCPIGEMRVRISVNSEGTCPYATTVCLVALQYSGTL